MSQAAARAERVYSELSSPGLAGGRVIKIGGRPGEVARPMRLVPSPDFVSQPLRRQSSRQRVASRAAAGPDRLALWAVVLALFMAGLAVVTNGGGDDGSRAGQPAAQQQQIPLKPR